ncbi:MAG: potassium transporter TrkG, partial [Turicibacter sp.]
VLISFVVIEFIFMMILGHYYYFAGYYPVYSEAMLQGFFTTVSAITNSGFDITGFSLMPFKTDYFVQTLHMFLMFFGAMGFPVILDIIKYYKCKRKKARFRFSVYTKLTMITTVILWIIGIVGFYMFEYDNFLVDKGLIEGFFAATFNSLSTRNAGFATYDMNAFSTATLVMYCGLMFIGSSPNSSGGGIRTTTFATMVLAILSFARGKQYVNVYGREIETTTVYKSFMIYIVATFILFLSTLLITMTDSFSLMEIFFEVCSAFGTTGLSMGITGGLTAFAKIVLIVTMFIGRIGIVAFLLIFRDKNSQIAKFRYPKIDFIIG